MELWRLISTFEASPEFNMGLDQALLETPEAPPTLRLYTWSPDTLSLGYFQRFDEVPRSGEAGAIVRRITGGGAIHHTGELTFSLACSLEHPLYRGAVGDSYARIHRAIAVALAKLGVAAELRGERALASDREGTGMCFHHSTDLDLVWDDRKGVGSAQRRKGGRVLHHGSIKLASSPLEGDIATLERYATLAPEDFAPLLLEAFRSELAIRTRPSAAEADERDYARTVGPGYRSEQFLHRR
ncbi:MAG: lipoate--protein ligase family protein [Planctomycetes bacterium]|nr:lipoate--protein ligase family protein [Planctomycetota bacterium]